MIAKLRYNSCILALDALFILIVRPSKFPFIERNMQEWIVQCHNHNVIMTDALIRNKARDIAKSLEWPEEKFKASSGWVENFKHRHGIRKGLWNQEGKNSSSSRANGCGAPNPSPDPRWYARSSVDDFSLGPEYLTASPPPPETNSSQNLEHMHVESEDEVRNQLDLHRHHPVWQSPEQSGDGGHYPSASHYADDPVDDTHLPPAPVGGHHTPPPMIATEPVAIPVIRDSCDAVNGEPSIQFVEVFATPPTMRAGCVSMPTDPEAETAIDTVLYWVNNRHRVEPELEILNREELDMLGRVKDAIFQAISGVPYNRQ